jgi:putative GTP pyrophosphokinase
MLLNHSGSDRFLASTYPPFGGSYPGMMNDQSTDWEAQVELLMNAFLANEEVYAALARQLGALLTTLLEREGVVVQSLAHRVKSQASLRRKLIKGKEKYDALSDVTDVVGCRLIVYLKEDVRKVAELVERSFSIDAANSVDKAALLDPDRFGYISLHYVARIGEDRSNLPEYRHFASIPFELQIRTVLQHAWAEIEHDLGYKSTFEIPREVRRQFSRLAGLLEIADDEFMSIKARLDQYAREVEEGIESTPELFGVDRESVAGLVERNTMVKEIDTQVATLIGARLQELNECP